MQIEKSDLYYNYLYFGYLPPRGGFDWLLKSLDSAVDYSYTIDEASKKWEELFDDAFSNTANKSKIIIPLSGGWDSRAILGAALNRVDAESIRTISFGAPGQLDYDIGRLISKKLSIKHSPLDLRSIKLTYESVLQSVIKSPWTYVPDALFNQIARAHYEDEDASIWIGFLGDDFSGEHLPKAKITKIESQEYFLRKQKRVKSCILTPENYQPKDALLELDLKAWWGEDDILDFAVRQTSCITPIVTPLKRWSNWNQSIIEEGNKQVVLPFLNKEWIQYWLNAPYELRVNRKLYLEMLNKKYKELLLLPTKKYFGASSDRELKYFVNLGAHRIKARIYNLFPRLGVASKANINYLDFNEMFRKRRDYKETIVAAKEFIVSKDLLPWLNLDIMMRDHMECKADYGDAFMVLIGYAANMQVNSIS